MMFSFTTVPKMMAPTRHRLKPSAKTKLSSSLEADFHCYFVTAMEDGQSHPPILHSYWERVLLEGYKVMGTQNSCTVNTKDTRTIPCF